MQNLTSITQSSSGNLTIKSGKSLSISGTFTPTGTVDLTGATIPCLSTNEIVVTNATLGATNSRAIKVSTSQAAANMNDGYGVVEIDHTITGTMGATGFANAFSSWVNIPSGTVGAGKYVCAQNNGIYEDAAATVTNAKLIFGMRAHKIVADTDSLSFPFSINTSNTAITALFDVPNITDMGWTTGAGSAGGGKIPFMRDANGTILYVNTYTS